MYTTTAATRAFIYATARAADAGAPRRTLRAGQVQCQEAAQAPLPPTCASRLPPASAGRTNRKDCAAVILYAAEAATRMALDAIQILGGNGCAGGGAGTRPAPPATLHPGAALPAARPAAWICQTLCLPPSVLPHSHPPPPPTPSYINEYPTGRFLRDAKLYEIGAGTSGAQGCTAQERRRGGGGAMGRLGQAASEVLPLWAGGHVPPAHRPLPRPLPACPPCRDPADPDWPRVVQGGSTVGLSAALCTQSLPMIPCSGAAQLATAPGRAPLHRGLHPWHHNPTLKPAAPRRAQLYSRPPVGVGSSLPPARRFSDPHGCTP